jgi:hypothetical protein
MFIPRALPLSPGGNTDVSIAMDVLKIIALPTPCKTLKHRSKAIDFEITQKSEEKEKTNTP